MKKVVLLVLAGILSGAIVSSTADAAGMTGDPVVMPTKDAVSMSYLQRAYFAMEQAVYYAKKSQSTQELPSFDYQRFVKDAELMQEDLRLYLYPRKELIEGNKVPFRIEGDFFMDEILRQR